MTKLQRRAQKHSITLPDYRGDIDGLRAIAVLSVVLYHAFPGYLKGGFVGVDIFFVLSGFLISQIIFRSLSTGSFNFFEFYSRRIRRIFPSLILVLSFCMIIGWLTLSSPEWRLLLKHILGAVFFVSNILLWQETGYFDTESTTKPLLHLWSLGIEEQFYLAFPLAVWCTWKLKKVFVFVLAGMCISSFLFNIYTVRFDAVADFYSPFTRVWELLAGSLLAYHVHSTRDNAKTIKTSVEKFAVWANLVSSVGLALVFSSMFLMKELSFPGFWALVPVIGTCMVVFAGNRASLNNELLSLKPLVWIGKISYPLYLWHWVILTFLRINQGKVVDNYSRILAVLLSIVLAWMTFKFIESPIRNGLNTWIKTVSLMIAMGALAIISGSLYAANYSKTTSSNLISVAIPTTSPTPGSNSDSERDWESAPLQDNCSFGFESVKTDSLESSCAESKNFETIRVPFLDSEISADNSKLLGWELPVATASQISSCRERFPERDSFSAASRNDNFCYLQKATQPNVLFIGDSMTTNIFPGISKYLDFNSLVLAASNAASLYNVRTTDKGDKTREDVYKMTNQALDYAVQDQGVKVVVLANLSLPLITAPNSNFGIWRIGYESENEPKAIFQTTLTETLEFLSKAKKRIIFSYPNPTLEYDPQRCVRELEKTNVGQPSNKCTVSRKWVDDSLFVYKTWVNEVLIRFPKVKIFDPLPYLCDDRKCYSSSYGKILYRDTVHLSLAGSNILAKPLHELIIKELN